jgi:hypothetical protein
MVGVLYDGKNIRHLNYPEMLFPKRGNETLGFRCYSSEDLSYEEFQTSKYGVFLVRRR